MCLLLRGPAISRTANAVDGIDDLVVRVHREDRVLVHTLHVPDLELALREARAVGDGTWSTSEHRNIPCSARNADTA